MLAKSGIDLCILINKVKEMSSEEIEDQALVGALIENRFILQSVLGRGGMSTVYLARHNRVDMTVAVKVLHTHFSDTEESIERFKREAIIINALNHHNIVHMISHGVLNGEVEKSIWYEDEDAQNLESEDSAPDKRSAATQIHKIPPSLAPISLDSPRPYLVLEHLNGHGLDEIIERQGRIEPAQALEIVKAIVEGLTFAHDLNIVHRDIKPSNVMIIDQLSAHDAAFTEGAAHNVKLLDFGIAKCQSAHDKLSQKLTQPGYIFGSPLYMSPEQCKGEELDARSDIYSLGCMFYEMLTGNAPLRGSNAMHTFAMHLYELPPLFANLDKAPNVSKELEAVIFKCLTKKPGERFSDAHELSAALSAVKSAHN